MKGLGEIDEVDDPARKHLIVERTYATHAHDRAPVRMSLEGGRELRLSFHRQDLVVITVHRILKAEAVIESGEVECLETAGRWSKRPIECICMTIKEIHIVMVAAEGLQEIDLFGLMVRAEKLFALIDAHHGLAILNISLDHLTHLRLDLFEFFICHEIYMRTAVLHRSQFTDLAVETARKRIIYRQHLVRIHLTDHILKHEAEGADVCAASVRMVISDEFHIVRIYDLIVERDELPVHKGRQHRHSAAAFRID